MSIGAVCRVVVVKQGMYRNSPEETSNGYAFKGAPPSDEASWKVLFDDVIRCEQHLFEPSVKYVRAYGYNTNDPKVAHVGSYDYSLDANPPVGTAPITPGLICAGDQAALVQWLLDRKSDKGKPTYLRKYFHWQRLNATNAEAIAAETSSLLTDFAGSAVGVGIQSVHGGLTSPGTPKDDSGSAPGGSVVSFSVPPWITTRTLKRRGKRPKTG